MFTRFLIYSVCLLLTCSCNSKINEAPIRKIIIDNTNLPDEHDIFPIVDSIYFTPLTELKGNYIGDQYKFFIHNQKIIVFDRFQSRKINLYDSNGVFIKNILKRGEADGDAFQINDCWLTPDGLLEAYDFALKGIFQFDSSYTLKNIVKGDKRFLFKKIIKTSDKGYIGYTDFDGFNPQFKGESFHLGYLSDDLNLKKADFFYPSKFKGINYLSFKNNFFNIKDTLLFAYPYDNFIYKISNSDNSLKYAELVYTANPLPEYSKVLKNIIAPSLETLKLNDESAFKTQFQLFSNYSYFDGSWFESDKYLYILSREKNTRPFITLITKKSDDKNTHLTSRSLKVSGQYDFYLPTFEYLDTKTNSFYALLTGDMIYKFQKPGHTSKYLMEKIENSTTTLYLVKVKLK